MQMYTEVDVLADPFPVSNKIIFCSYFIKNKMFFFLLDSSRILKSVS